MSRQRSSSRVGPLAGKPHASPALDVDALLDDRGTNIIVCCGSGGVGKTTTAAALALRAAERGRKVVVLTIDPARRLAQSMGIEVLDNTPRPVPGVAERAKDVGGTLDAMMLDMKRTFDEVVEGQASPEKAAQILANPFYQALSSSFAGTQEYMAMEKLGQLHAGRAESGRWDLIVVDTPPSRSALDFLDAPERLSSFLDGRFIRILLAPAKGPARLMTAGLSVVTNALTKVLGAQVLRDMQTFVAAFDTLFGGFRQRAQKTFELLQADGTAFLVVAAPEPDALREAAYFVERLEEERCRWPGWWSTGPTGSRPAGSPRPGAGRRGAADAEPDADASGPVTAGLLRLHADRTRLVARETHLRQRFAAAHPHVPAAVMPALSTDVHDLDGLRLGRRPADRLRTGPTSGRRGDRADGGDVVGLRRLEQTTPRGHVRTLAEQRTALTLGHAAPHAPLDLVVEGLGEALGAHRAPGAQLLGAVLGSAPDEQLVGPGLVAQSLGRPVVVPRHDVCSLRE